MSGSNDETKIDKQQKTRDRVKKRDSVFRAGNLHIRMAETLQTAEGGSMTPQDDTVEINPVEIMRSMRGRVRAQRARMQMKFKNRSR